MDFNEQRPDEAAFRKEWRHRLDANATAAKRRRQAAFSRAQ